MRRCYEAAGVAHLTTYDLRKFACTRIYRATGSIPVTMQFSGHRDPQTLLNHYIYAERNAAESIAPRIDWTPADLTAIEGGRQDE